jgi:hypothetical protein
MFTLSEMQRFELAARPSGAVRRVVLVPRFQIERNTTETRLVDYFSIAMPRRASWRDNLNFGHIWPKFKLSRLGS